jgi:hypothetical protein
MFPPPPLAEQYLLYMGKDKFENEDLIKYGIETDVWCVHSTGRALGKQEGERRLG